MAEKSVVASEDPGASRSKHHFEVGIEEGFRLGMKEARGSSDRVKIERIGQEAKDMETDLDWKMMYVCSFDWICISLHSVDSHWGKKNAHLASCSAKFAERRSTLGVHVAEPLNISISFLPFPIRFYVKASYLSYLHSHDLYPDTT